MTDIMDSARLPDTHEMVVIHRAFRRESACSESSSPPYLKAIPSERPSSLGIWLGTKPV